MRRLLQLLLLVSLVSASATGVRASTDCERWFVAYKQQLAHAQSIQRVEAARRRARLYAKRKLAGYIKPNPANKPQVPRRRPMSRDETLRHFNLACGVLPDETSDQPLVSEETPVEFAFEQPLDDVLGLIPEDDGDVIASNDAPPPFVPADNGGPPSEGGPPMYYPPFGGPGGFTTPGGPPGTSGTPPCTTACGGTTSTPPVVPEPGSYVFLLTGLAAAAGVVKRRFDR